MQNEVENDEIRREIRFLGYIGEEAEMAEREVRSIVFGAFLSHPIAVVSRTLSQLGYNRLPLTKGRYFLVVGPSCFFHANAFSYARHLYQLYGFRSLWVGAEIALVKEVLACAIRLIVARQLRLRHFEFGGAGDIAREGPRNVFERFQLLIRFVTRSAIVVVAMDLISFPFILVQTREVAQLVCDMDVHEDIFESFSSVYVQSGLLSLYSGFTPLLVSSVLGMLLTHAMSFSIDVIFYKLIGNPFGTDARQLLRSLMDVTCSFLRKSITYPFALTSILMSTFGSSLPVRDLNVRSSSIWSLRSTKCSSWWQVHQLLWSSGNQWRGQYSFFRLYRGALQLGWDGLYYAAPILSL